MAFWRRQRRSIRKRLVHLAHGKRWFVTHYLGADFLVRLDNIMGRELAYRSFERDRIENFITLCSRISPDLFIDIGANCGAYACILLRRKLVPRAVLFEPDSDNANLLRINLMINRLTAHAELHQVAAGSIASRATLVPGPPENKGQSRIAEADSGYPVEVVAVDEVVPLKGKTLAVKIDVEGFERETLTGMTRLLRDNHGIVQVESYDHADEVTAALRAAGYKLVTDLRPDFVFAKA
jgi:FkbM family methyltransferase